MRIWTRDSNLFDPGSGMEKLGSGINKYPGSATLLVCYARYLIPSVADPDPGSVPF
jgi:hypothetical protein